jgi:uncharacterized protein (TIGR02246 family)
MTRNTSPTPEGRVEERAIAEWVEGYERAWDSNARDDIERLFTEDARYFTAPHREPWAGKKAIVEGWLAVADDPGGWELRYEILATAGDLAFVRGWTSYADGDRFSNLWVIRLDPDGRCSEFTEWWMEE